MRYNGVSIRKTTVVTHVSDLFCVGKLARIILTTMLYFSFVMVDDPICTRNSIFGSGRGDVEAICSSRTPYKRGDMQNWSRFVIILASRNAIYADQRLSNVWADFFGRLRPRTLLEWSVAALLLTPRILKKTMHVRVFENVKGWPSPGNYCTVPAVSNAGRRIYVKCHFESVTLNSLVVGDN